jgi:subtilisin family serine protease
MLSSVVLGAALFGLGLLPQAQAGEGRARYLVVLKRTAGPVLDIVARQTGRLGVKPSHFYRHAVRGYAARLTAGDARALAANPTVAFVERDRRYRVATTQPGPPWGLDRIDQTPRALDGSFSYLATGAGVTAYVIDTGVRFTHGEFNEAGVTRATSGKDFVDPDTPATDCNGHGTHVAGTIGGETYGVAKGVSLVAVRVIDCWGFGWLSDIVGGVNWVTNNHPVWTPAVANMSLGGPPSRVLNLAVRRSIADGVVYTLAAGNQGQSACNTSPARVPPAITVSATNRQDVRPYWANFGSCVDLFAPGTWITSAWKGNDSAWKAISGTSMAAPHVAGVVALQLELTPGADPAATWTELQGRTTKNVVTSARSANNDLLFTDL